MCPLIGSDATAAWRWRISSNVNAFSHLATSPLTSLHETGCCQKPARVCSRVGNLCGSCYWLFLFSPPCSGQLAVPARNPASRPLCDRRHLAHSWPSRCSGCSNHGFVPAPAAPLEMSHVFSNLQLSHQS